MKKSIIILLLLLVSAVVMAEGQEQFPFLSEITDDKVNVRAGQAVSFEQLGQLTKGSEVVVVAKEYGWCKIKLPEAFPVFISSKYIRVHPNDIGEILGSKVNVRARAGENFTVLGKLTRGTLVHIRNKSSDWYEIEPLEGVYGWVADEFVKFKSQTVPPIKTVQIVSRNIYARKKALAAEAATVKAELAAQKPPEKKKDLLTVTGKVQEVDENDLCQEFRFKIVAGETVLYFLRAPDHVLTQFCPYQVKIEGGVDTQNTHYPHPVINIVRINFIL